ncbi:MAG: phosphatidate cytidylyltransferase [Lachnospiraceae bacterium]|nr:phosphatidate cytidylyltransferase [Lachnospiraceae bacterium]
MFVKRLISGIVLLVLIITLFAFGGCILAAGLLLISLIAYVELSKVFDKNDGKWKPCASDLIGLTTIVAYYVVTYLVYKPTPRGDGKLIMPDMTYVLLIAGVLMLAQMIIYVKRFPELDADRIAHSIFSFFYAPFMLSFIYFLRETGEHSHLVWIVLICSWGCDTCAYCVGVLIGKHRVFPKLSPKKTMEGCIGGIVGAAIIGALYGYFYVSRFNPVNFAGLNGRPGTAIVLSLICGVGSIAGMIGDLAASGIKRNKGIKDYGTLIPGHGGIMDRFDSITVAAPIVYILSYLIIFGV